MTLKEMTEEEHLEYHGVPATRVRYADGTVGLYVDGCVGCQREKAAGSTFFPSHFASTRCESGKYDHCTCEVCW